MDDNLIFIKGIEKSDQIASYRFSGSSCIINFKNSSAQYPYNRSNVELIPLREEISPQSVILYVDNCPVRNCTRLLDYGKYYKICLENGRTSVVPRESVSIQGNCLAQPHCRSLFNYFKSIAAATSLVSEGGFNLLGYQYEKIHAVSSSTALSSFLSDSPTVRQLTPPRSLIYPFGLNQSQKTALENAFSSQISIIQGPPGTGKTQTILNIIANAVRTGKTVAVVSNNNSATHNVVEKLAKKDLSFIAAFLGSRANKEAFLAHQSPEYPDMDGWLLESETVSSLKSTVQTLTEELNTRLDDKNRIAQIEQELLELVPESQYFEDYYRSRPSLSEKLPRLTSAKYLALSNEYEGAAQDPSSLRFFSRLKIILKYGYRFLKLFRAEPDSVLPFLQREFYSTRIEELNAEKARLEHSLASYSFDRKMDELSEKSMLLFRHELALRYSRKKSRPQFTASDFWKNADAFNKEYPVVLSTTYSIKSCLDVNHTYDYLIVDESSQVDLATGVLALSCAQNVVIVGDLKQLPNVITDKDRQVADRFWDDSFCSDYRFTENSLLSSAALVWKDAPSVLLREHYRCNPKIINFCNQKFYDGKLIIMTKDDGSTCPLTLYKTPVGNHARGHINQREIDVIRNEVLPALENEGFHDIGVIAPYRDQVNALHRQLPRDLEVDTVHKFQGREKDAIVLSSVDNRITDFVDDFHMLNVAVSRAVRSLVVVTSQNPENDKTNYGDLARYISYHNFDIIESKTYSVFDLLYKENAVKRMEYLKKHRRYSEYDSENLMYGLLEELLAAPEFSSVAFAMHVPTAALIRDCSALTQEETVYIQNPLTHTDFLLFYKMDKSPLLAIEVDGVRFHADGTRQAVRDRKKDSVFAKVHLPLLRLKTNESGEAARITSALRTAMVRTASDANSSQDL